MAFGTMWAGTGLGGVVMPLVLQASLAKYGHATVLRGYAIIMVLLMGPILPFIRPRLPPSPIKKLDLTFLGSPSFLLFQAGNVLEALGYFLPAIYLPTFATSIGASDTESALTVVLMNVAAVIGCIGEILFGQLQSYLLTSVGGQGMGFFVDKLHVTTCQAISMFGSVAGVFLLWGLSTSLAPLYLFSFSYGLFAGSYSTTWMGVARIVSSKVARAPPMIVFAFIIPVRGIGNIISGPLSAALLADPHWTGRAGFGYGTKYGPLIIFTGLSMLLSGVPLLGRMKRGLLTVS